MRGFDGLISAATARASSDVASSGRGEVASKLGMGAARCGHPVFMAGSGLGSKARREAWTAWTPIGDDSVHARHDLEEGDNPDTWARRVSEIGKRGEGTGGCAGLRLALLGRTRKQGKRGGPRAGEGAVRV